MKNYRYKTLKIIVVSVLLSFSFSIQAASLYEVEVLVEALDVYEYPVMSSKVIAVLAEGVTTVVSQSDSSDWYFVSFDGKSGYIASNYVKKLRTVISEN